jgi:hypothetical protein
MYVGYNIFSKLLSFRVAKFEKKMHVTLKDLMIVRMVTWHYGTYTCMLKKWNYLDLDSSLKCMIIVNG